MKTYVFTDLSKAGQRAIYATWMAGAALALSSLAYIYQNVVISRYLDGASGDRDLVQSDNLIGTASIGSAVILIIAFVINGRFLFLASRNASAIEPDPKAITPGWAVGWYFVPIANFWVPFTAMKQTWSRLLPNSGNVPKWLGVWWLSWVLINLFDRIISRMAAPDNLPDFIEYNVFFIISGFLWLIPTYLFARIIAALKDAKPDLSKVFD